MSYKINNVKEKDNIVIVQSEDENKGEREELGKQNEEQQMIQNEERGSEKEEIDQIECDHKMIAAELEEESNPLQDMKDTYAKYLSVEEKKTLEKLQDNTIISIEKYKDIIQQSSQKKNSEIFSETLDLAQQSGSDNSSQMQLGMSFYQYKQTATTTTNKPNQEFIMPESSSSYQSDKYSIQNVKKLQQQESEYFGEEIDSSINNNIQQQLFHQNDDNLSQSNSQINLQTDNYFGQAAFSNSQSTIKSRGLTNSFFNDKSNGGEGHYLDSIQECEELGRNNHTNSSSYPQQQVQSSKKQSQQSNSHSYTQFELYRQQMKKESGSRASSSPRNYETNSQRNNKLNVQYFDQSQHNVGSDMKNKQFKQDFTDEQINHQIQPNKSKIVQFDQNTRKISNQQKTPSRPTSEERREIAFINKQQHLEASNQKESYSHPSGFTFEKIHQLQDPSHSYTSFKYKTRPNSSPDQKLSPNNLHEQQKENDRQFQASITPVKKQSKPQQYQSQNSNKYESLVNSLMKSDQVRVALDDLNMAIQSPIKTSPSQRAQGQVSQFTSNKKDIPIAKKRQQNLNENNQQVSAKILKHIQQKDRNLIFPNESTPSCFSYLNETSNTSIMKNTLIEWFDNQRMLFQKQIDSIVINNGFFNQNSTQDGVKQNKYVVSEREVNRIEDFLIEFEVSLTQNNGVININLESKLQEFLNNEAKIVSNRITDKKQCLAKNSKLEDHYKKSIQSLIETQPNIDENDKEQQNNPSANSFAQLSSQSRACFKIQEVTTKVSNGLIGDQNIFNYVFHKKVLADLSSNLNLKAITVTSLNCTSYINEQKITSDSELKTQLFAALFSFLANFHNFIPIVNQRLLVNQLSQFNQLHIKSKTWESSLNLLNKSGMILSSIKNLSLLIEKEISIQCQLLFPYQDLLREFDDAFWQIENLICTQDKLIDDSEYSTIIKLIYSIKTVLDVILLFRSLIQQQDSLIRINKNFLNQCVIQKNYQINIQFKKIFFMFLKILVQSNLIEIDKKQLQINKKITEDYMKKRQQKVKDGIQLNSYLDKTVKEEENNLKQMYGIQFQEWESNLEQIAKDINSLKGKEKKSKWIEQRTIKKNEIMKDKERNLDDFERSKQFGNNHSELVRTNYLKDRESKRERANQSTEIRMIEKKQSKSRNKSMIQEQVENTISEQVFKKEQDKKVILQKKQEHEDFLVQMKEKREKREKQIEKLKKTDKEEKVWKRAQELLEKQSKLLYEREQLLKNKKFF